MVARPSCPDAARWAELLDDALSDDERARMAAHLDACERCQETVEGLTASDPNWAAAAHTAAPEPGLRRAIAQLMADPVAAAVTGPAAADVPLDFLAPSDEPGCLGRLGRYEVSEVIGRGGMGVVLKALDPALNRVVAIKVLAPQWAGSGAARSRFAREGRATAAVRHENVVAVYGVEEVNGLPYLVMEYVHGVSLQEHLDRTGPLELTELLRIAIQAADGLAAAHAQGLVHRDVKPANILLENGVARVKLTDFGLARAIDDASLTQSGVLTGTPLYMAPEQARGVAVDPRADLFSLGSVLYLLCTGRPAFRAPNTLAVLKRVCEDTPRSVREINPDVPAWLEAIISRLHSKSPSNRFASAEALSRLLSRHLAHLHDPMIPAPPPVSSREDSGAGGRRRVWPIVLIVALVCGAFLGGLACVVGVPVALVWKMMSHMGPGGGGPLDPAPPPRAMLGNPKVVRDPDGTLHIAVDYQIDSASLDATMRYVWVVRSGQWKIHEQKFTQAEMGTRGTLKADAPAPLGGGDAALETCLECERLIPGKLGWQHDQISDVLKLPPGN
jgi:serine/threonine-protein kinase